MKTLQLELIEATSRLKTLLAFSATLISLGVFLNIGLIYTGVIIIVLIGCIRVYVNLELYAISKCRVEIPQINAMEGDEVEVNIIIKNPTLIPVFFAEAALLYSPYLRWIGGVKNAILIIPARSEVSFRTIFQARIGMHEIGPIKLIVRDLFALFRFNYEFNAKGYIRVFPRVSEVKVKRLLVYTRTTGLTRARRAGSGVELYSVKEFRDGDDVRRIVWKYLAAKHKLVVKELELETMNRVIFVVDATISSLMGPYGYTPFEHYARLISSISKYLSHRGDLMYLLVYSDDKIYHIERFVKGTRGYQKILSVLSSLTYPPPRDPDDVRRSNALQTVLGTLLRILPREKSLVFMFTTYGGEVYQRSLVDVADKLIHLSHEVFVIIPLTTTFEVRGIPEWGIAMYRVKTFETTMRELEFAKTLRTRGIKTIAITAEYIPQILVNLIEMRYGY